MTSRGTPGPSPEDRVARATALIRALAGVIDVAVEAGASGIRTIVVVAEPELNAWEVGRNIQSALLASLGLAIDMAIVEVRRPGDGPAADATSSAVRSGAPARARRPANARARNVTGRQANGRARNGGSGSADRAPDSESRADGRPAGEHNGTPAQNGSAGMWNGKGGGRGNGCIAGSNGNGRPGAIGRGAASNGNARLKSNASIAGSNGNGRPEANHHGAGSARNGKPEARPIGFSLSTFGSAPGDDSASAKGFRNGRSHNGAGGGDLSHMGFEAPGTTIARLELESRPAGRVRCRALLAMRDEIAAGQSDAADTPAGRLDAAARAVVAAASAAAELELDGVRLVELAGRKYVIAAVRSWSGRDIHYRAEVAPVEGSPEAAAAQATLSAILR